jgi:hypothetical protein
VYVDLKDLPRSIYMFPREEKKSILETMMRLRIRRKTLETRVYFICPKLCHGRGKPTQE